MLEGFWQRLDHVGLHNRWSWIIFRRMLICIGLFQVNIMLNYCVH